MKTAFCNATETVVLFNSDADFFYTVPMNEAESGGDEPCFYGTAQEAAVELDFLNRLFREYPNGGFSTVTPSGVKIELEELCEV